MWGQGGLFTGGLGSERREKSLAQHEKTHEGLIVGNRSIKYLYSHIKCFRVSLFISYLFKIYSWDSGSCNPRAGSAFWRLYGRSIYVCFPRGTLVTTRTCRAEWSWVFIFYNCRDKRHLLVKGWIRNLFVLLRIAAWTLCVKVNVIIVIRCHGWEHGSVFPVFGHNSIQWGDFGLRWGEVDSISWNHPPLRTNRQALEEDRKGFRHQ